LEERGLQVEEVLALKSMCYIATDIYPQCHRQNWPADTYVIPEYAFGFECKGEITLSHEHSHYAWMTLEEARQKLTWDSNKTAAYELYRRLGGE
jgi:dATP pyrophosphohydrolase